MMLADMENFTSARRGHAIPSRVWCIYPPQDCFSVTTTTTTTTTPAPAPAAAAAAAAPGVTLTSTAYEYYHHHPTNSPLGIPYLGVH